MQEGWADSIKHQSGKIAAMYLQTEVSLHHQLTDCQAICKRQCSHFQTLSRLGIAATQAFQPHLKHPLCHILLIAKFFELEHATSKGKRLLHAANKRLDTKCLERKLVNLRGLLVGISPSLEVFKGANQFCTNVTSLPNTQMTQKKDARCSELLPHTNGPAMSWVISHTLRRVPTRNRSKRRRIDISSPWSRTFPVPIAKIRLCPEPPPCLQ